MYKSCSWLRSMTCFSIDCNATLCWPKQRKNYSSWYYVCAAQRAWMQAGQSFFNLKFDLVFESPFLLSPPRSRSNYTSHNAHLCWICLVPSSMPPLQCWPVQKLRAHPFFSPCCQDELLENKHIVSSWNLSSLWRTQIISSISCPQKQVQMFCHVQQDIWWGSFLE